MTPGAAAAIILSAGFSARMGEFKPLMPLGGMPVLERVIRLFRTAGVGRIHVVVGHRGPELTPLIERQGARAVVNPRYAEGMYSSVKAGAAELDDATEAFFTLPVDIPLVRPATVSALLQACPAGGSAICYPTFGGRRGHPPLIGCRHIRTILDDSGDAGLAGLLRKLKLHARDVPVADEFIHADMDTPEDYRRLAGLLER
jgi:molybdenum cofactor cytidylyltransferase